VISILFYCTVLLCNLAQEFPSGLMKFYLSIYIYIYIYNYTLHIILLLPYISITIHIYT